MVAQFDTSGFCLLKIKLFERVFPSWHPQLDLCLCFTGKKKGRLLIFSPLSLCVYVSPALVWWYRSCTHKPKWLFARQKIKDKVFLQPLKHVPHLLISTSAVKSESGICCRPHQICTTYFYGSWPYMLQSADELNTHPEHKNIVRRVHVSTHGRNNTGKGSEGTLAVLLWPIQQKE